MASDSDLIERFVRFLAQAERSPLTVKNYRGDLGAFAAWFEQINGEVMAPAKVTPTDLRQFKRWLVEQRNLKPSIVNRKLATLNQTIAQSLGLSPEVLATRRDIEQLAEGSRNVSILQGWRRTVIGEPLLAAL